MAGKETAAESATACTQCLFGWFSSMASDVCSPCPETKDACPLGKYRSTLDILCRCIACEAGKHGASSTSIACENCAKGKYAMPQAAMCSDCPIGKRAPQQGMAMCDSCKPGTYANVRRATICTQCEKGKFQPLTTQTSCNDCPCGKYQSHEGSAYCQTCAHQESSYPTPLKKGSDQIPARD